MYKTVKFRNFKSLKDFTIHLRAVNVLVGPNNAGKSTVLDAVRVMSVAHTLASHRLPQSLRIKRKHVVGYELPQSLVPILLTNIHSDYQSDQETSVVFILYPVHVTTRKSFGLMTRKLSVTESHRLAQFRGTFSRRKPSVASANWAQVA